MGLAESFAHGKDARLAVVCTASPCASDIEHGLTTLRTGISLCLSGHEHEDKQMLDDQCEANKKPRVQHPKAWTADMVRAWVQEVADGQYRDVLDTLPANFTGQMLVRLTEGRCIQLCGGSRRRGHAFFELLRVEMHKAG